MLRPRSSANRLRRTLALLGLALAVGCTSTDTYEDQDPFRRAIRESRFDQAEEIARQELEANPGDAEAEARLVRVEVARRVDLARSLVFEDQPQAALDLLVETQAMAPDEGILQVWIAKVRNQLAWEWLEIAASYSGDADLENARAALQRALLYVPDNPEAQTDLERTLVRIAYRKDLSDEYFITALRKLREARYVSADRDLGISTLYDAANLDAARRREDVRSRLAGERNATAAVFETEGLWFAALGEYRAVLFLEPENEVALDGVERLEREVQAEQHLRLAEMMVRRREFAEAHVELDAARALTAAQVGRVEQLEGDIEAARWQAMYDRGEALYGDQQFEEAVAILSSLLDEAGDFADARQLRDTLVETIAEVEGLYQRASEADDDAARLSLLRQVQVLWPEYRDVPQQVETLQARLEAQAAPGDA